MSVDLGTARAKILLDTSQLASGVSAATGQFAKLENSTKGIGASLEKASGSMALIGGAVTVGLGGALKVFGDFESQMNQLGVVSGATGEQMSQLGDLAKQLGEDTTFGATESASALVELSKAGVSVEDVLAGAGKAAANLAQAGGQDLAKAATTMANAMNVFGLEGKDAAHIADVFANAANKSAADVDDLAQALAQVGTVAKLAGLSLEDTTAALAMFADAGLKGSDAGTSLKTMLTAMIAPSTTAAAKMKELGISFVNAKGEFVGLAAAAATLQAALGPLTEAQRNAALAAIFGQDAIRAGAILYEGGAAAVNEYTAAMNETGSAEAVAAANMAGLNGAIEQMRGAVENAALALGGAMAPAMEAVAGAVGHAAQAFAGFPQIIQQVTGGLLGAVGGLALLGGAIGKVASGIGTFVSLAKAIRDSERAMTALGAATSPVALAFTALAVVAGILYAEHRKQKEAAHDLAVAYDEVTVAINRLKLADLGVQAQQLADILGTVKSLTAAYEAQKAVLIALGGRAKQVLDPSIPDIYGNAIVRATVSVVELQRRLKDAQLDEEELAKVTTLASEAMTAQGVNTEEVAGIINKALATYQREIKSMTTRGEADEKLIATLQHLKDTIGDHKAATDADTNAIGKQTTATEKARAADDAYALSVLDNMAKIKAAQEAKNAALIQSMKDQADANAEALFRQKRDAKEAGRLAGEEAFLATFADQKAAEDARKQGILDDIDEVKRARQEAADQAAAAEAEYQATVDHTAKSTINAIKGLEDQSDALEGTQTGYHRVGETIEETILRMDRLNKVDLSAAEREALHLSNALKEVEETGAGIEASIQNNQEDYSMWAGRIKLVTDLLGGNSDAVDEQIKLLQEGKITQEQYNAAVADPAVIGAFEKLDALREQGLLTEKEYQAAQKAGIHLLQRSGGALQDENAELVKNLTALDEFTTAHDDAAGAVDKLSKSSRVLLGALQTDTGAIALQQLQLLAYLADIGTIPEEKVTQFIVDASKADPVVAALFDSLGLLDDPKHAKVDITVEGQGEVKAAGDDIDNIHDKDVKITVSVGGDGTDDLMDLPLEAPPVTIPTVLDPPDDTALTDYEPAAIRVPVILNTPLDDHLTGYEPKTIRVPTILEQPHAAGSEGVAVSGPDTITIPTKLGSPDTTLVDDFDPLPIVIDTALGTPATAAVDAYEPKTVTIPTVFGAPGAAGGEGVAVSGPSAVTIPTKYGAPDETAITGLVPPEVTITTSLDTTDLAADLAAIPAEVTTAIAADTTDFDDNLSDSTKSGDKFDTRTFAATLDAHHGPFDGALEAARIAGVGFSNKRYEATLDADNDPAFSALKSIKSALGTLSQTTYITTIDANIQPALDAIATLGDHLPASPAKKGPLSKEPSFDYVTEAFVAAMADIERLGKQGAMDLVPTIAASLRMSDIGLVGRQPGSLSGSAAGGTTLIDARQFYALTGDEMNRLLAGAEMGGAAHDWLIRREHAFSTVGA